MSETASRLYTLETLSGPVRIEPAEVSAILPPTTLHDGTPLCCVYLKSGCLLEVAPAHAEALELAR